MRHSHFLWEGVKGFCAGQSQKKCTKAMEGREGGECPGACQRSHVLAGRRDDEDAGEDSRAQGMTSSPEVREPGFLATFAAN